jgi:branched-chain amino acid transport system substrate-binding protein
MEEFMKRQNYLKIALVVFTVLSIAACKKSNQGGKSGNPFDSADTITIGGGYQLSGQFVSQGDIIGEGIKLAVSEINAAGGVLGKKLVLVEEDAGETTQDTITATTKLLERGNISAVFGCLSSSYNIAVSDVMKEYKVPLFANGSSANVWKENNEFIWQVRVTDNYGSEILAKAAVNGLKMAKPGLLYCTNSFGQGMANGIKETLQKFNIKPSGEVTFAIGEANFASLVTRLMDTGCDGIIAISDGDEAVLIMKQIYNMGIKLPCIGSSAYGTDMNMRNAGYEAAAGWYTVSDWAPDVDTPENKRFLSSWSKMYPNATPLQQNLYSYDGVFLLAEAIKTAGTAEPQAVNRALSQIKSFQGAMSVYTPDENRSLATTQILCENQADGRVAIIERLAFR